VTIASRPPRKVRTAGCPPIAFRQRPKFSSPHCTRSDGHDGDFATEIQEPLTVAGLTPLACRPVRRQSPKLRRSGAKPSTRRKILHPGPKDMLSIKTYAAILTDVAFATNEDPDGAVKERYLHAAVMQNSPASTRAEVPLGELGARQAWEDGTGRVDVVIGTHGIELKVLAFPRVGATPSNALYDVGQLASDYWRLQNAKKLQSGELLLLLHGPLVPALASGTAIYREFTIGCLSTSKRHCGSASSTAKRQN
jgi:hypothetical protein